MKKWFSLALVAAAIAYTAYGLGTLRLLDMSGRPGAGYFPLIVGILLIVATAVNAVRDFHASRAGPRAPERTGMAAATRLPGRADIGPPPDDRRYGLDVLVMLGLLFLFIVSLTILGGLLSMMAFMLTFLCVFNRGKIATNVVYSLTLPLFLYWLFRITLNASLPIGVFGF